MTRKVNIPVMIFALVASFICGFEIANNLHDNAAQAAADTEAKLIATMNARSAVQGQQISALNKLALAWQTRATACEQQFKPAGQFLQGALDVLQGGRR